MLPVRRLPRAVATREVAVLQPFPIPEARSRGSGSACRMSRWS